jgi:WD40 repeat protein
VFSPDGRHIASGSDDSTVRIWDAVTGTELQTLQGPEDPWVMSVAFSPDSTRIISSAKRWGPSEYILWLWDTGSGKLLDTKEGPRDASLVAALLTPLQKTIPTNESQTPSAQNTAVHIFSLDFDNGWLHCKMHNQQICWIPVDCRPGVFSWSPNNYHLAFGLKNGQAAFFDLTGIESHCRSY